ncbi:MAG: type 2 lanthipeptide synthetase LanM [Longimonas sp.]|uniref:type 2 lanthipeptide synthetase LanM n=1 Tax=Longimonas sp. TaxID=2039626 RepID=UPI00335B88F6
MSLPPWASWLVASIEECPEPGSDADRFIAKRARLPFQEALAPFVRYAGAMLEADQPGETTEVAPSARADMERELLTWLCTLAAQVLVHEFGLFRMQRQSPYEQSGKQGEKNDTLYQAFVQCLCAGDWCPMFQEYSALARLMGTAMINWVERSSELLARFTQDHDDLESAVGPFGRLVAVRPLTGDRHNYGRTVLLLTGATGRRVVYKPRSLGLEANLYALLQRLTEHDSLLDMRTPTVIDRGSYGWMSFVEDHPCDDEAGLARYYRRMGMLMAVIYSLNGIDCHMENLVAEDEHPVLVDAETLFYPEPRNVEGMSTEESPDSARSVVWTDVLPWEKAGHAADISGFSGGVEPVELDDVPVWDAPNTDAMALTSGTMTSHQQKNAPRTKTGQANPNSHQDDLREGFVEMYRVLMDAGSSLLNDPCWSGFQSQHTRYLPRSTEVYTNVLMRSLRPAALLSGVDRDIELDVLSRALATRSQKKWIWPLIKAEQQALRRADLPFFTVPVDSQSLSVASNTSINAFFETSGADAVEETLHRLGHKDLREQLAWIDRAFERSDSHGVSRQSKKRRSQKYE